MRANVIVPLVVLLYLPVKVSAETAEFMLSACKPVVEAKMVDDGHIALPEDPDAQQCWGAFGVVDAVLNVAEPFRELVENCIVRFLTFA